MKKKSMVVDVAPNHFSYTKQKSKISSQKEILSETPKRFKKTSGRLRQNASAFLKKTAAFFLKNIIIFLSSTKSEQDYQCRKCKKITLEDTPCPPVNLPVSSLM